MIKNLGLNYSLVQEYVSELRDINLQTNRLNFRNNLVRLGSLFAYEISKELPNQMVKVKTPLTETNCLRLSEQPIIASILRAGLPFHQGFLNYFDKADSAFVSSHRAYNKDHTHFKIILESLACPAIDGRILIIADPMLATGSSQIDSITEILKLGTPKEIHIASIIASDFGINLVNKHFPEYKIWVGAIDPKLDQHSYIVPGIGDAGDLAFGPKIQN